MSNRCYNYVKFTGNRIALKKVELLFQNLAKVEECGVAMVSAVFFNQEPQNHFFSIKYWYNGLDFIVDYATPWTPNVQDILKIANEFEVSFIHDAFEPCVYIYQRCIYRYAEFLHFPKLVQNEFMVFDFDKDEIPYDPKDYQGNLM